MRIKTLSLILLSALVFNSCETDFDLNAEWKDIPVVYGIINPSSNTQNIRIQRAFLGDGNALTFAKIPDSNYYDTAVINAKLIELNGSAVVKTIALKPMWVPRPADATNPFYNPDFPYILIYKTEPYDFYEIDEIVGDTIWFNPNHQIKLEIRNSKTGKLIQATTPVGGRMGLSKPGYNIPLNINETTYNTIKYTTTGIGKRFESILRFRYKEYHPGMADTTLNSVDFSFGYQTSTKTPQEFEVKYLGSEYFKMLGNRIPANREVKRIAYRFDIILRSLEEELKIYLDVNSPSSGLVQDKPLYTNLSDGYGIFSSANTQMFTLRIHPTTINSIKSTFSSIDNSF